MTHGDYQTATEKRSLSYLILLGRTRSAVGHAPWQAVQVVLPQEVVEGCVHLLVTGTLL